MSGIAFGCSGPQRSPAPELTVEGAWARATSALSFPSELPVTAVYLDLVNGGGTGDRLLGGVTPVAEAVELHESRIEEGMAAMYQLEEVEVPASGRARLQPGGVHLMLVGVRRALMPGDSLLLLLRFERSEPIELWVPVRAAGEG